MTGTPWDIPALKRKSDVWTMEQLQRLFDMFREGLSFSAIGWVMGKSRNAVIGKATRMGLKRTITSDGGGRHVARAPIKPLPKKLVEPPPEAPTPIPGVTIATAMSGQCRWIADEVPTCESAMCGHPAHDGPWCPFHRRLAYQPFKPRLR